MIAVIVGAVVVIVVLMAITIIRKRRRRLAALPLVMSDVISIGSGKPETPPKVTQDALDRSRMLGISLDFVIDVFPDEAREMKGRLLRHSLTKPNRTTRDESFLNKVLEADEGGGDVYNLNFSELAEIVAHGEMAYGKGIPCPRDGKLDCSIVDAVHSRGASSRATVFLSWVWGYKLSLVLSALRKYRSRQTNPEECFIWWCFFQNNQFRILGDNQPQDFFTLKAIFGTQLRNVGKMVAMMDRVTDSKFSSRLWCLFEVYTVSAEAIPFEVVLPEEASVEIDFLLKGGLGQLKSAIKVEARKASSSFIDDENHIKSMIESLPGDYNTLDMAVRNELRRVVEAEIALALSDSPP